MTGYDDYLRAAESRADIAASDPPEPEERAVERADDEADDRDDWTDADLTDGLLRRWAQLDDDADLGGES